jgi:hypothetical protein
VATTVANASSSAAPSKGTVPGSGRKSTRSAHTRRVTAKAAYVAMTPPTLLPPPSPSTAESSPPALASHVTDWGHARRMGSVAASAATVPSQKPG